MTKPYYSQEDFHNDVELFIDKEIVDQEENVFHTCHSPLPREIVWQSEEPWEGITSTYFSVLQDHGTIRIYYRGGQDDITCLIESKDGINFSRPELGLIDFQGSKKNNIVYSGPESHNFAPFIDVNPSTLPGQRYKCLAGYPHLFALASADGIHWQRLKDEPVLKEGAFDSHNVAFFDKKQAVYRCYSRLWVNEDGSIDKIGGGEIGQGVRGIQSCVSDDLLNWSQPQPNKYHRTAPIEDFYTNATIPAPASPHQYLAFPMLFFEGRKKIDEHFETGVSDAAIMSSRDGILWERCFPEAWIRPGMDPRNWTDRSTMVAHGIVACAPNEYSLYVTEHYRWPDNRLRRYSLRKDGFASMRAKRELGTFITRPISVNGDSLFLNYSTSASGFVQVEVLDEDYRPIPGFERENMSQLYGDEITREISWDNRSAFQELRGKVVRLKFYLSDADVFAFQIK